MCNIVSRYPNSSLFISYPFRKQAREEVQARKRQVGGVGHPPIVVAVVPLLDQLVCCT